MNQLTRIALFLATWAACCSFSFVIEEQVRVRVIQTPSGGIQPQVAADSKGGLHLLYYKGDAGNGDLFYVARTATEKSFSEPLRVNSTPGSAIAAGTIRGGQIALGKDDRVHVAWNGSGELRGERGVPMLYARLKADGSGFEEQRNLMQQTEVLDGGGTIAADRDGNVYVAWHAKLAGDEGGEEARRVWIAYSKDSGATFSAETPAWERDTGACGCCSMRALATSSGALHLLYRSANEETRDVFGLELDRGTSEGAQGGLLHPWKVSTCPMSSMALAEAAGRLVSAWETAGQVFFSWHDLEEGGTSQKLSVPNEGTNRKHPTVAVNSRGEILVAWTEGTGWARGGDLVWQLYDSKGKPISESRGRVEGGVPVWGLPSAATIGDNFVLFH